MVPAERFIARATLMAACCPCPAIANGTSATCGTMLCSQEALADWSMCRPIGLSCSASPCSAIRSFTDLSVSVLIVTGLAVCHGDGRRLLGLDEVLQHLPRVIIDARGGPDRSGVDDGDAQLLRAPVSRSSEKSASPRSYHSVGRIAGRSSSAM